MAHRSWTQCVEPADFTLGGTEWSFILQFLVTGSVAAVIGGIIAGVAGGVFLGFAAGVWAVCDRLLNGKLVCLGGNRCVVGHIASIETNGFFAFDDDVGINLLMSPWQACDTVLDVEGDTIQGNLIAEQPATRNIGLGFVHYEDPMPCPADIAWSRSLQAKFDQLMLTTNAQGQVDPVALSNYLAENTLFQRQRDTHKTILHCEIEGPGIHDFCVAVKVAGVAVGGAMGICIAVPPLCLAAMALAFLIAIIAWLISLFASSNPAPLDAATDGSGDIHAADEETGVGGDYVIITGRWCYDSGHAGWNEIHPVLTLQKGVLAPTNVAELQIEHMRWCGLTSQSRDGLTQDQQEHPDNRWTLSPQLG